MLCQKACLNSVEVANLTHKAKGINTEMEIRPAKWNLKRRVHTQLNKKLLKLAKVIIKRFFNY